MDMTVSQLPSLRETSWLVDLHGDVRARDYYGKIFDAAYAEKGAVDYWDYQWMFAFWSQAGLAALPETALLSYIGFGPDATHHTSSEGRRLPNAPTSGMSFPLLHPPCPVWNQPPTSGSSTSSSFDRVRRWRVRSGACGIA
jgi:hypothetical protein